MYSETVDLQERNTPQYTAGYSQVIMSFRPNYPCITNCCFQCVMSVHTPMAEVRWDDEKVRRVCQVFAKQLPILLFLWLTQRTHQHRHDAKLVFVAATSIIITWLLHAKNNNFVTLVSLVNINGVISICYFPLWSHLAQFKFYYMIPVFQNHENGSVSSQPNRRLYKLCTSMCPCTSVILIYNSAWCIV